MVITMYYYSIPLYSNTLSHHGILGQKWGKRNGPPYPLDAKDHSKSEQKAGWRKSLEDHKNYSKAKRTANKEATKKYYQEVKTKPEYIAKRHLREEQEKIRKSLAKQYPEQAKNEKTIKKIATGVGIAAIVGATVYVGANAASYNNALGVQMNIFSHYNNGDRAASIIGKVMDKDIGALSDRDEIITAGETLQRVIRDFNDADKALSMEKAKDFIYATFDKNDNEIYKTLFNARGNGKKLITTREVLSDLRLPSALKRATAFKDLLNDSNFIKALESDLKDFGVMPKDMFGNVSDINDLRKGQLFDLFNVVAGNSDSESAPIYFKKIADMGYNAIRDDNDSGYLGKMPVILLNASNDTVVKGYKKATQFSEMMSRFKLENVPKYDKESIFSREVRKTKIVF